MKDRQIGLIFPDDDMTFGEFYNEAEVIIKLLMERYKCVISEVDGLTVIRIQLKE